MHEKKKCRFDHLALSEAILSAFKLFSKERKDMHKAPYGVAMVHLTHCMLLSFAYFFSKGTFSKKSFRNTSIRVSNSLDPDQDRHSVGPDLGPTCLQRLSADCKSCHY